MKKGKRERKTKLKERVICFSVTCSNLSVITLLPSEREMGGGSGLIVLFGGGKAV